MTTKPVAVKILKDKSGKVRVKAKPARAPAGQKKNRAMKTARLAKAWAEKSK